MIQILAHGDLQVAKRVVMKLLIVCEVKGVVNVLVHALLGPLEDSEVFILLFCSAVNLALLRLLVLPVILVLKAGGWPGVVNTKPVFFR